MEFALPLLALGGLFVMSKQNESSKRTAALLRPRPPKQGQEQEQEQEPFHNMGGKPTLPNTDIPPSNYPIMNNRELTDNVQEYPNPNVATDKYFDQNRYEQKERGGDRVGNTVQQFYSLTGDYMNTEMFTHNNMVPFNGSKPQDQTYHVNVAESVLDNYVGSGSQVIKKIEQAPLFKPQDNVQWNYGMPNVSDFLQSRENPSGRNNMVKSFESIRVGPGLNQGYGTEGSNGFNAGMEARDKWLPKTVDELRVATNPKQEYDLTGLQGPAQSRITNVGIEGRVEKYRPDTFFINSQDRWLTTTGAEKAGQLIPDHIVKPSMRNETTTHLHGAPSSMFKTAGQAPSEFEASKRTQLEAFEVGHSVSRAAPLQHTAFNNQQLSHTNYHNHRSTTQPTQTFGSGFARAVGAAIAPLMDILKPSRKEEHACNVRVYGNLGGAVPESYARLPGDALATTVKETTLYEPRGYINSQRDNAGYLVNEQQPTFNQRDTTNHDHLLGMASTQGVRTYDAAYRQTNNETKELTVVARTNHGNASHFNPHINVSMARPDADRENNRLWAPQATTAMGPSLQTMGKIGQAPQSYDANQGCDRISGDLLQAFRDNPYTFSLSSVA